MSNETVLPDGSAFFTASMPLPKDHWIYAPNCQEWDELRDTSADVPHPILTSADRQFVIAAVRYAVRGATMNGKDVDFDPDALVQNACYALCGPSGTSISSDEEAREPSSIYDIIYNDLAAADNNDIPLEEYPERLIAALSLAGYCIMKKETP